MADAKQIRLYVPSEEERKALQDAEVASAQAAQKWEAVVLLQARRYAEADGRYFTPARTMAHGSREEADDAGAELEAASRALIDAAERMVFARLAEGKVFLRRRG